MKKRMFLISGLALLAISITACSEFNPFITSNGSKSSITRFEPKYVSFDIFTFNDTHGNVKDTKEEGLGLSKTATALKELSQNKNSIFISQGDMWQGSVESNYTKGKLVTEWMNEMNFVSMTVGNHEYDWGSQVIKDNIKIANFPMLGINVLDRYSNQRVDYLEPSVTFMRGEAKIGVIGAIGNCISSISSSRVKDVYFAKDDALINLVKQESTRLRNEEHCDFIIYSIHGSATRDEADNYDISLSKQGYVDLVLEGHTHSKYAEKDSAGIYHIQCDGSNNNVCQISVNVDINNDSFEIKSTKYIDFRYEYSPYRNYAPDSATEALLEKYYNDYSFAYGTIGYNSYRRSSAVLKQKVADLYLEEGLKKWGSNYDILLGGGYISCRSPYYLPAGEVTYSQIASLFPFDNEIVLCSVKGSDLQGSNFVNGSNDNYYLTWTSYGNEVRFNINYSQTYYLISDTYSSDYSYNHLTVIDTLEVGLYARDLLKNYIAAGNWA